MLLLIITVMTFPCKLDRNVIACLFTMGKLRLRVLNTSLEFT